MGKVRGQRSGENGGYSQVGLPGLEWSDAFMHMAEAFAGIM